MNTMMNTLFFRNFLFGSLFFTKREFPSTVKNQLSFAGPDLLKLIWHKVIQPAREVRTPLGKFFTIIVNLPIVGRYVIPLIFVSMGVSILMLGWNGFVWFYYDQVGRFLSHSITTAVVSWGVFALLLYKERDMRRWKTKILVLSQLQRKELPTFILDRINEVVRVTENTQTTIFWRFSETEEDPILTALLYRGEKRIETINIGVFDYNSENPICE